MAGSSTDEQRGCQLPSRPAPTRKRGAEQATSSTPKAAPPLRSDAPERKERRRGALPQFAGQEDRDLALRHFREEIFAPTTRYVMEQKLKTVVAALKSWGMELLPPTSEKIHALGATLKAGGYRSGGSYLTLYKGHSERAGFELTGSQVRAFRDSIRSCERGLGGPVKARPLPFDRLSELPIGEEPWTSQGPLGPGNAVIAGAWFLTREIELSTTRAALVELRGNRTSDPSVTWHLPASKADADAVGCSRTHGCTCTGGSTRGCPVHSLWDQLLLLKRRFPGRWSESGGFDWDLPLFPDASGKPVSKEAMTDTIRRAATLLSVPLSSPDHTEQVTGHSLRATGAQGFAKAGLDEISIQLLGRWGSKAIRGYTREAALERSSAWARAVGTSLGGAPVGKPPVLDAKQIKALLVPLVAAAARDVFPGLLAKQADALKRDLTEELKSRQRQLPVASSDPLGAGKTFVKNKATGVYHILASSPSTELSARATLCGWRFAGQSNGVLQAHPASCIYKLLCEKCLPDERALRKNEVSGMAKVGRTQS